jgi:hypothetical protein
MSIPDALHSVFTEKAAQQNRVTDITIEAERITVYLEPDVAKRYARPDCQQPVVVQLHDRETIVVQGLGMQGRALRYVVTMQRLAYLNDAGKFVTFTLPMTGLRTDLCVTDEVVERALYLLIDCNLPTPLSVQMLQSLYHIETSESALARWKSGAAAHLPSVGILIQHLNEKKR